MDIPTPATHTVGVPLQLQEAVLCEVQSKILDVAPVSHEQVATALPELPNESMGELQRNYPDISPVYQATLHHQKPSLRERRQESEVTQLPYRQWERLRMLDKVLKRSVIDPSGGKVMQVILPQELKRHVLSGCHESHGHQGLERTESMIRQRCYWPHMHEDIAKHLDPCNHCVLAKKQKIRAPLGSITATRPLEVIAIDLTVMEPSSDGRENVLVITDVFPKWSAAFPTRDQKALTVARILVKEWFHHFGVPQRIHSDQGRDFEAQLVKDLCHLYGVAHSHMTSFHPSGNGQAEMFNRILHDLLCVLEPEKKRRWAEYLGEVVYAYNTTPHAVHHLYLCTNESPGSQ